MLLISCRYPLSGLAHWFLCLQEGLAKFHPLPRTGSGLNVTMSSSRVAAFASRSAFNAYTLFLFSKSDMKTTVIPVVCNERLNANGILTVVTVEPLRFGRCALVAHSSNFACHTMLPVGLASRTPVQFIKPTSRPGRRYTQ